MGIDPAPTVLQTDFMSARLRREVWDELWIHLIYKPDPRYSTPDVQHLPHSHIAPYVHVCRDVFGFTLDQTGTRSVAHINDQIRTALLDEQNDYSWCCEIIEIFLDPTLPRGDEEHQTALEKCATSLNEIFARHMFGYRLIDGQLVPVTDKQEIASIAAASTAPFTSAREHYRKALRLLSDREAPDPANAVKESITALEALTDELLSSNEKDFSKRVDKLGQKFGIHGAQLKSWKSLYGYASDKPGARHGTSTPSSYTMDEAKCVLVSVSAIINYLTTLAADV